MVTRAQRGFTLPELLVVITVLAILMAAGLLAVLAPLQVLLGDLHGLNTLKHQPIKIAAMEAHWDTFGPGNFHVFAWPDEEAEENRFAISIPQGASLILTHRLNGQFLGLKEVPPQERPPVNTTFFAFRIMLAAGFFGVLPLCPLGDIFRRCPVVGAVILMSLMIVVVMPVVTLVMVLSLPIR